MKLVVIAMVLLVLAGCAAYSPAPAEQPPPVAAPTPPRYRIDWQYRGARVLPDFAIIERNGDFVIVPKN